MITIINLLPWRQTWCYAYLCFWGILSSTSLLLSNGMLLCYYSVLNIENRAELLLADAEKTRAEILVVLEPRIQRRQQRRQQVQARNKQCEQTRSWQSVLQGLAESLSEQAWLIKTAWQQDTLELTGNTLSFTTLQAPETQSRQQSLFQLSSPGETQQDARERWQSHYRLTQSDTRDNDL